jgi:hypothetical protein
MELNISQSQVDLLTGLSQSVVDTIAVCQLDVGV